MYNRVGVEMMTAIDVALAKGGCEAVVESLYSVMKTNATGSNLSNDTLSLRTIVDWCFLGPSACTSTLAKVAEMHLKGDSAFGITEHRLPMHVDRRRRSQYFEKGKVTAKIKSEIPKLPFLLEEGDNVCCLMMFDDEVFLVYSA